MIDPEEILAAWTGLLIPVTKGQQGHCINIPQASPAQLALSDQLWPNPCRLLSKSLKSDLSCCL